MDVGTMSAGLAPCTNNDGAQSLQIFKQVYVPSVIPGSVPIAALEPAAAPGVCVFNTPNGVLAGCSCAALMLVRSPLVCNITSVYYLL